MTSPKVHQLGARRGLCPRPGIRVQQLIEELGSDAVGEQIESTCTDPGALYDIPAWAKIHGHKIIDTSEEDYEYRVIIEICEAT